MPADSYEATEASGKRLSGVLEGRNEEAVVRRSERRTYILSRFCPPEQAQNVLDKQVSVTAFLQRIRQRDVMDFTHQLGTLVDAGLPLDRALGILTDLQENPKFKNVLLGLRKNAQSGS